MRRLAIPADQQRVYDIYMHPDVVPYLGFDPMPREAFGKVFEPLFESGSFYVFEEHGQVQGFYKVQRHLGRAAHVAYLGTLAVAPQAKGSGLNAGNESPVVPLLRANPLLGLKVLRKILCD